MWLVGLLETDDLKQSKSFALQVTHTHTHTHCPSIKSFLSHATNCTDLKLLYPWKQQLIHGKASGEGLLMFELWENGDKLDWIDWIYNTKHLFFFLHVSHRLVSAGWDDEKEKFFRIESSDVTNGCFLCVMKREVRRKETESDD